MTRRLPGEVLGAALALLAIAAAPLAQDRLVIDVGKSKPGSSRHQVIDYGGTGSVRHSEQRASSSAQARRASQGAGQRAAGGAGDRRTGGSQGRTSAGAGERRAGGASDRHGSVRLDTIR